MQLMVSEVGPSTCGFYVENRGLFRGQLCIRFGACSKTLIYSLCQLMVLISWCFIVMDCDSLKCGFAVQTGSKIEPSPHPPKKMYIPPLRV